MHRANLRVYRSEVENYYKTMNTSNLTTISSYKESNVCFHESFLVAFLFYT